MFEQQSYAYDVPADELREGDLFYQHEVGRWKFDNRLYAIIAGSAVFIFAFFGGIAQTPFLTARGCDSPFVGRVCQVLDMAYVGTMLYGTDREYVDAEYEKIDLKEAEVVWIDQTGVPAQLEYPEGYFQIANPEQFAGQQAMLNGTSNSYDFNTSGFPVTPPVQSGSSLIDTPAIKPKNNPNARPSNLPESPFQMPDEDTTANENSNKGTTNVDPGKKPNSNQTANANKQPTSSPVDAVQINRTVLEDLGNLTNEAKKNGLDLKVGFIGSAKATLTKEGRIDPKTLKLQIESSDDKMKQVVQEGILAIDAAGYLQYLKLLSGKTFDLLLKQDEITLSATIQSEMESETRATSIASSLDLALAFAKKAKESPDASQNDKDDLILLQGAKIRTDGKRVIITFDVPKETIHPMIERKLAEHAAAVKKPSGQLRYPHNDNTAAK